ncbi:50S ribosomal protein L15 [Mesoplasma lactucae]|uniref:Large ribosomal subunit protein uL15 n=1 Tax=Mesoplasma lactucae ATCC 49193 TaxID=81460 RepID=A0A291IR27_9MOLU|nr:50S ribosomal protein L15 [Mesoplasma lactucae]ATG97188.1 50S ribosomal protein L15 [Mesoplasma lactucae ATCC 49193]ATZ20372.1 50S ribosomal protein L15 [Mesoplasma lactucae ATCC 49193]MCL8216543.1 50S ribosomal protein L15 [Mesoplasma lactucae ATCC 49193]
MKLNELKSTKGSRKDVTRVGRGTGSGKGKTASRGHKGQNSRSGGGVRPGFEGGQTPLFRRLPKVGFNSLNRKEYVLINLGQIENFDFNDINPKTLVDNKIIKNEDVLVKILGNGTLTKKVNVKVNKISQSAKDAIEKNGGTVEVF